MAQANSAATSGRRWELGPMAVCRAACPECYAARRRHTRSTFDSVLVIDASRVLRHRVGGVVSQARANGF